MNVNRLCTLTDICTSKREREKERESTAAAIHLIREGLGKVFKTWTRGSLVVGGGRVQHSSNRWWTTIVL